MKRAKLILAFLLGVGFLATFVLTPDKVTAGTVNKCTGYPTFVSNSSVKVGTTIKPCGSCTGYYNAGGSWVAQTIDMTLPSDICGGYYAPGNSCTETSVLSLECATNTNGEPSSDDTTTDDPPSTAGPCPVYPSLCVSEEEHSPLCPLY